ncbi:CU044_5270 family protein [Streptomyces sp. NBC_00872]|uniref:CU044_5270 family protein n=1 Tax=Streptomyces sp. NBC_00872 TaxID=2903686 RepID=UPI00386DD47E|nr:CU044_5270 family protein [Streptomyces sp. NBC_00872]
MNAEPPRPTPAEREEMARLLPVPADRDLPGRRHQLLKDHLMREVRQRTTTDRTASRPLRRRLALAAVPLAAGAVAAVVLATGSLSDNGPVGAGSPDPTVASGPSAAVLLDRIAVAAASRPAPTIRDDQYVHIVSEVAPTRVSGPNGGLGDKPHTRQIWLSVDGSRPALLWEYGTRQFVDGGDSAPSLNDPTYRYLESLPTDPGGLLTKIYDETEGMGSDPHEQAFTTIGDLLGEQLAPPKVSAALYRAAAKIPGVTVVDRTTDAAGRDGVAVARVYMGKRTEWIFNKDSLHFLGQRSVMVEGTVWGEKGEVIDDIAVLSRTITDKPGQTSAQAG